MVAADPRQAAEVCGGSPEFARQLGYPWPQGRRLYVEDGTTEQVHDLLRDKTRPIPRPQPRADAAVVDAQSVKTSANVAETSQGIDAGKKIKGRKRLLITDTLGLVLAVLVTAASVHDTAGGKLLLEDLAAEHPSVSKV